MLFTNLNSPIYIIQYFWLHKYLTFYKFKTYTHTCALVRTYCYNSFLDTVQYMHYLYTCTTLPTRCFFLLGTCFEHKSSMRIISHVGFKPSKVSMSWLVGVGFVVQCLLVLLQSDVVYKLVLGVFPNV